jgi:glutamine amidotransferase
MHIEVEVLDLGINNLASLVRGLGEAGASDLRMIASADETRGADLLVLPGVGAFGAAVAELEARGLGNLVQQHVRAGGYLFGVCLGMQLLGTDSDETPGSAGLDLIPGHVRKLEATGAARVPNMGWSGLSARGGHEQFPSLAKPLDFYFVHSFALAPAHDDDVLAVSEFGESTFVSGVLHDRVMGMQFHPEKSSRAGAQLLGDVLEWARG